MAQTLVTDSNLTPVVQIVTWFLLTTSISGVIARGLTKANIIRSIDLDDALVSIALVRITRAYVLHLSRAATLINSSYQGL